MSRCFPFPPPGYEKDTFADTDLLAKEKRKEKKHKKDKKDKDKKESKEKKKDKEGGERKHKDKKDRKEKHREKKDRDREKKGTSVAEDGVGQSEGLKGGTSGSKCLQNGETSDPKFVLELGKRIRDDDGARENGVVKKCVDRRSTDLPGSSVENGIGNSAQGSDSKSRREDARSINGRSTKIEQGIPENACHRYFGEGGQKTMQGETLWNTNVDKQKDTKPKYTLKDTDGSGDRDSEKKSKSVHKEITKEEEKKEMNGKAPNKDQAILRGSCDIVKNGQSAMLPDHLKKINKPATNGGILGKRKEHEVNGFLHDHGVSAMKLPRPTSPSQVVGNGRKLEKLQTPVQGAFEKHLASSHKVEGNVSYNQIPQNGRKVGSNGGSVEWASEGLRAASDSMSVKEAKVNGQADRHKHNASACNKPPYAAVQGKEKIEALPKVNGLLAGQQLKTQLSKPPPVPVEAKEQVMPSKKLANASGVLEARQSNNFSSKPSFASGQVKEEVFSSAGFTQSVSKMSKEVKVNGYEKAKLPSVCLSKPTVDPVPSKGKVIVSQKLPHRDLKYLDQILSVPVVTEWSDFDDQGWLFSSGNLKAEAGTLRIDEAQNVWAEAFLIESADITALPYVIPF